MHISGGIRTRNFSKQTAADPPLTQHEPWDRHLGLHSWFERCAKKAPLYLVNL